MSRLSLSDAERGALEARVRGAQEWAERERSQAVLMAAQGLGYRDAAAALCCSERSVRRHVARFRRAGLEGMRPGKAPGKRPLIPPELEPVLLAWVEAGPQAVGARCTNWTHRYLAEHLARRHGVRVSRATMGAWCRAHGVRPYRPTYRFVRADVRAREAAARELTQKKRPPSAATSSC
jgi:transposase